jgi:outer membrane protein
MKRIVIAAVTFMVCSFGAQAQYFVGGQFGFSTTGGSEKTGDVTVDKPKTTYFNFSPKAGMFLSEKFAVGMSLNVMTQRVKNTAGGNTTTDKTTSFGIAPFARYYFLQMNKFGIFAEGQIGLAFSKSKRPSVGPDEEIKATTFGLNIAPVIYYNLSEKFTLEASVRLFNFGINTTTEKDLNDNKEITNSFGFGAGLDGLVNTGNISVGATYKF